MYTKAAVVCEYDEPILVETLVLDEPKNNEIMIRMAATGVCHSDISVIDGNLYYDLPIVLGHEGAGVVEKIGPGVCNVQPGDHVILSFVSYCDQCTMCQQGHVVLCNGFRAGGGRLLDDTCRFHTVEGTPVEQMARIGTMSEYTVVPEQSVIKIDKHYPLEQAALVGCGITTGVGAVLNTAQVKPGSTVAIIGAGGVGLNVIQGAVLANARQIIAVDIVSDKLDTALAFGATDVIDATKGDPVKAVRALTHGGVDYAFEAIGNAQTAEQAYRMIRITGTAVVVGIAPPDATVAIRLQQLTMSQRKLIGSFYGSAIPHIDMPKILTWYEQDRLKIDELITATYTLDRVNYALDDLRAGKNTRGVIVF